MKISIDLGSDSVTLPELLRLVKDSGVNLNERTVKLYADMGLIPRPDVRNRDEGGRSGYYDRRIADMLTAVPDLQKQGYSLRDIKSFMDTLEGIARQSGKDPVNAQVDGLRAIASTVRETSAERTPQISSPNQDDREENARPPGISSAPAIWRAVGAPVIAEMLRRGMVPDVNLITELTVSVSSQDGECFTVPVFIDHASVDYANPTRKDDAELGTLTSAYLLELAGKRVDASAEATQVWLENSYDMSRANFLIARKAEDGDTRRDRLVDEGASETARGNPGLAAGERVEEAGHPILGFVALGVEPERIRAGQVRLGGPYVVPRYRGLGLGRGLMDHVEAHALALGAKYIDAYLGTESKQGISFLRHCDFAPDHFIWEAHLDVPDVLPTGEDPLADKSRMRNRLEIRPTSSREELEQTLALEEQVLKGTHGYYRATPDDLLTLGLTFPMESHFGAYLDGEFVGTVWNSMPSPRVYAVTLPRYQNTWIELALWRHILRYLRAKGIKVARTEAVSEVSSGRKALPRLGFVADKMVVCYRKWLVGR